MELEIEHVHKTEDFMDVLMFYGSYLGLQLFVRLENP